MKAELSRTLRWSGEIAQSVAHPLLVKKNHGTLQTIIEKMFLLSGMQCRLYADIVCHTGTYILVITKRTNIRNIDIVWNLV